MKTSIKGFTLVELAIVLVIIGLLVTGILAGEELIQQAKIRGTIRTINEYNIAVNTFAAKYNNARPGDFNKATEFGIGQNLAPAADDSSVFNGNNNHELERATDPNSSYPNFAWEMKNFFVMLSNAALVKGNFTQAVANSDIDVAFPSLATGGGMVAITVKGKLYYLLSASANLAGRADAVMDEGVSDLAADLYSFELTPAQAYSIDSKLDDGNPNMGGVQTFWSFNGSNNPTPLTKNSVTPNCASDDNFNDPASTYIVSNNNKACLIYVKASN